MRIALTTCLIILGLVSGCATLPDQIPELDAARNAVDAVDRNPMAERVAGAELEQAKEALQRADTLRRDSGELDEILHQAYVARRHAEIVDVRIAEAEAREQIEDSEAERKEVLLAARSIEANEAQREAQHAEALAAARGAELERQRELAEEATEKASALEKSLEELKAERTERGLVLTLGDVLFDTDKAQLKPGADRTLDRLAEFMADNENRRLIIEGHTDSRGKDAYNQSLSQQRANAVQDALASRGVEQSRLRAVGRGESAPVATNDTRAGRQQNRRVEIIISDAEGEFPSAVERAAALRSVPMTQRSIG